MYLDWLANVFIFWGAWEIGKKHRHAFILYLIGEILWITWAVINGVWSLVVASIIFGCLSIWNWIRWAPPVEDEVFDKRHLDIGDRCPCCGQEWTGTL